jgi:hypothetical protein
MFLFICVICGVGVNLIIDRHGRCRSWQVCEKVWGAVWLQMWGQLRLVLTSVQPKMMIEKIIIQLT